jgi:hypothetical protein
MKAVAGKGTRAGMVRVPFSTLAMRGKRYIRRGQEGRWGYILAWLLGVPIPILIIVYLLRGCT